MSKKQPKPNNQNKRREEARRRAVMWDGNTRAEYTQAAGGYDAKMIRDFLDHLLLELRVQLFENTHTLRALKARNQHVEGGVVSLSLVEKLRPYYQKYNAVPITSTEYDRTGCSDEEVKEGLAILVELLCRERDEQIGHLEALQPLFEEALKCIASPFGHGEHGEFIRPARLVHLAELLGKNVPDEA